MKKNLKLIKDENVIISTNQTNELNNICIQVLKTGVNKGNSCNCKVFKENLCARHYNLINKKNNNENNENNENKDNKDNKDNKEII